MTANRFAVLLGLALSGCVAPPPAPAEERVAAGEVALDGWEACVGDDPCAANVYCDADAIREDARCLYQREGVCLRYSADEGLDCFPAADGSMRVGKCSAEAACVEVTR